MFRILNARIQPRVRMLRGQAEPQVHFFAVKDDHFAYDANSMALVHLEPGLWKTLRDGPGEAKKFGGMLWCRGKPQFNAYLPRVQALVLNVTHKCNLACRYCFVRNVDEYQRDALPDMTYETAIEAINYAFPPGGKAPLEVGFFGGEPFVNWRTMARVVDWVESEARDRGVEKKLHITTNATLIDDEKAQWLKLHGFSLVLSLDGNEVTHNAMRPARNPQMNSWLATMKGLERLATFGLGPRITLRSTFTAEGVDLVERLHDLNTLVWRGMAGAVAIEPASLSESSCVDPRVAEELAFAPDRIIAQFGYQYERAADWYIEQINDGRRPHFHHFDTLIRRLLWTEHNPSECGAGKGYLCVNPKGGIYACHRETRSRIGALPGGVDEHLRAPWMDNRIYSRIGCMECPWRHVCGGGCRVNSLAHGLTIHEPAPEDCIFKRLWIEHAAYIMAHVDNSKLQELYRPRGEQRKRRPQAQQSQPRHGPMRGPLPAREPGQPRERSNAGTAQHAAP